MRDFSEYDLDLETFMKEVVLPDCPPPFFALGHSMGASVLIRSAYRNRRWFDRIVLSGSDDRARARRHAAARPRQHARCSGCSGLGALVCPGRRRDPIASLPFAGNPLTSDPVRYARIGALIEAEPALGLGSPTIAWADAAFRAMSEFADPAYPARMRQPILMIAAGQDRIVSLAGDRGVRHPAARRRASRGARLAP